MRLGRVWAGVIVLAVVAGSFSLMSPNEQGAVRQVNAVIRFGLAAHTEAEVPVSLKSVDSYPAQDQSVCLTQRRSSWTTGAA